MTGRNIQVILRSPAKVDLRTLMAGTHSVSTEELDALRAAGIEVEVSGYDDITSDEGGVEMSSDKATKIAELEAELSKVIDAGNDLADMHETLIAAHASQKIALDEERQKSADLTEKLTAATAEIDALKAAAASQQNTPVAKIAAAKKA